MCACTYAPFTISTKLNYSCHPNMVIYKQTTSYRLEMTFVFYGCSFHYMHKHLIVSAPVPTVKTMKSLACY